MRLDNIDTVHCACIDLFFEGGRGQSLVIGEAAAEWSELCNGQPLVYELTGLNSSKQLRFFGIINWCRMTHMLAITSASLSSSKGCTVGAR